MIKICTISRTTLIQHPEILMHEGTIPPLPFYFNSWLIYLTTVLKTEKKTLYGMSGIKKNKEKTFCVHIYVWTLGCMHPEQLDGIWDVC